MTRYVALNKTKHRYAGLSPVSCSHAKSRSVVPLVVEELPHVVATMVSVFVRDEKEDNFHLAALQSLSPGRNVYVNEAGQWLGGYKPAWYREHPFRLVAAPDNPQNRVVCVDEDSEFFHADSAPGVTSFFDEEGELTEVAQNTLSFLEQLDKSRRLTGLLVAQLAEADLIVPWEITARSPGGEGGQKIAGLYHIDEKKLRNLSGETAAALLTSGAMSLALAQLMTEHRLKGLVKLHDAHGQLEQAKASADDLDLEELFADDDNLTF